MSHTLSQYDHAAFPGAPVQQADAREQALADGLRRLATKFGLTFQEPLHIDSRGEFNLFLETGARYGETFVLLLNKHSPRTGVAPTKFIDPLNSWCMMSHFNVARMLDEAGARSLHGGAHAVCRSRRSG